MHKKIAFFFAAKVLFQKFVDYAWKKKRSTIERLVTAVVSDFCRISVLFLREILSLLPVN